MSKWTWGFIYGELQVLRSYVVVSSWAVIFQVFNGLSYLVVG